MQEKGFWTHRNNIVVVVKAQTFSCRFAWKRSTVESDSKLGSCTVVGWCPSPACWDRKKLLPLLDHVNELWNRPKAGWDWLGFSTCLYSFRLVRTCTVNFIPRIDIPVFLWTDKGWLAGQWTCLPTLLMTRLQGDMEISLLNYVDAVISRQCNKAQKRHTMEQLGSEWTWQLGGQSCC